jgi:hypothetical protein
MILPVTISLQWGLPKGREEGRQREVSKRPMYGVS